MEIMNTKLDLSSLEGAIKALQTSIEVYHKFDKDDADISESLRSGVIQNFEVAYELCWKFMKRWLEININPEIAAGVTRKEFYRIAGENKLIADIEKWWVFHEGRNRTSHIYDGAVADDVLETAFQFLPHAKTFVSLLEQKL